ncbi:YjcZ family sporulation protein [Paenibacillus pasadenensis]|uniref:YjcZ family sporulation protein n=1 Tax=Paenibacillus pasadenensis TaxID=217090 RepID=UPI00203D52F9|nr:YjcZ family sporulation protein [Paenibacillus pasadenensis]MCM3747220.1 YjcZ family sporulation protein [Paenibacillus pasadenensis]
MNDKALSISNCGGSKLALILVLFILLVIITSSACGFRSDDDDDGGSGIAATYGFNLINNSSYALRYYQTLSGTVVSPPNVAPSSTRTLYMQGASSGTSTARVVYRAYNVNNAQVGSIQFTMQVGRSGGNIRYDVLNISASGSIRGDGAGNDIEFYNA